MKVKKTTSLFLVFLMLTMSTLLFASATDTQSTGCLDSPTTWETSPAEFSDGLMGSTSLQSQVDRTAYFPTPGDQGTQLSCVGWAVGYALRSQQENVRRGWTRNTPIHNFSPAYIYNQIAVPGGGSYIEDALNLCINQGVCSLQYFPYDQSNYFTQPTSIQREAASLHKALSKTRISGIDAIKARIAGGDSVIVCFSCYSNIYSLQGPNSIYASYDHDETRPSIGHCVCLVGYDDSVSGGSFKAINSWGTSWGDDGYFWITYDMLSDPNVNRLGADRAWALNPKPVGAEDYIYGDVDDDGIVTAKDSRLVQRYSAQLETMTARHIVLADVDGDAVVTAADARLILRYSAELISDFPVNE